ncbi:MAG: twin-arginine translocation pathway signal protein [Silicimonas sp.]
MDAKKKKDGASRRDFLKFAGTSAPAAVAAMAVGTTEAAADEAAGGSGLKKTEHVKKYLASARF